MQATMPVIINVQLCVACLTNKDRGTIRNPTKYSMIPKVASQKNKKESLDKEKEQCNHTELKQ